MLTHTKRALRDERGSSQVPGFITVAVLAFLAAVGLALAADGLNGATQRTRQNDAARTVLKNVCTQVYAFGLDPATNARLRAFAGGTETVPYPVPSATPINVVVKVGAASGNTIGVYATAGAAVQQGSCTIPSPKPVYGSTQTAP